LNLFLSVQIVRLVREYQGKLFNSIMKGRPSPTTVSTVGTKRDHESDDEDPEGDIRLTLKTLETELGRGPKYHNGVLRMKLR
jgi:hypothetical protein